MRRLITLIVLMMFFVNSAFADIKGFELGSPPAKKHKLLDASFWVVSGALTLSTAFDGETTFYALDLCQGKCHEGNTFLAPHVANGRADFYATEMALNIGIMGIALVIKSIHVKWLNWLWPILPALSIGKHIKGGMINIHLAASYK